LHKGYFTTKTQAYHLTVLNLVRFFTFRVIDIQGYLAEFVRVWLDLYLGKCEQNFLLLEGSEMFIIPVIF